MRKRLALILLSCVLCVAATAQQPALTVGTATAVTGQTVTGFIEVSAGSDVGTNIPVAVIRGPKPGPTLALVAGAHGTEYASIIALEKLIPPIRSNAWGGSVRRRQDAPSPFSTPNTHQILTFARARSYARRQKSVPKYRQSADSSARLRTKTPPTCCHPKVNNAARQLRLGERGCSSRKPKGVSLLRRQRLRLGPWCAH